MCFERCAQFLAKEIFKSNAVIKTSPVSGRDDRKLNFVNINKNQFENILRQVLLFYQYRIELYNCVNAKSQDWQLKCTASPGNLSAFEDILLDSGNAESTTVIALKFRLESDKLNVAIGCFDLSGYVIRVADFVDSSRFCILESLLVRIAPKECLLCSSDARNFDYTLLKSVLLRANVPITERKSADFKGTSSHQELNRLLKLRKGENTDCTALPQLNSSGVMDCLSALIKFLNLSEQCSNFGKFRLESLVFDRHLRLDSAAVKSLEVFDCGFLSHNNANTLYGLLNKCRTMAGKKLLNEWLRMPLLDVNQINERLDVVEAFVENPDVLRQISDNVLNKIDDLPKILRAFSRNKADLQHVFKVYQTVQLMPNVKSQLLMIGNQKTTVKALFLDIIDDILLDFEKYASMVNCTLEINRKSTSYEVRVKRDFDENLNVVSEEMANIETDINVEFQKIAKNLNLEPEKGVKLENTAHLGFFCRISRKDEKVLRNNKNYRVLETQKAGVRFSNAALKRLNDDYNRVYDRYDKIHSDIVKEVVSIAAGYIEAMRRMCDLLATLDVIISFAGVSFASPIPYVRPIIHEKGSGVLRLINARHPCLERQDNVFFIPNDVEFSKNTCELIMLTGPNMGGKSTYLRQTALIVIMAQCGCFVPCSSAEISIFDGIFTRIGASDCQLKGVSTFMAEMIETSFILEAATEHSLIVIDELGRGTSTYDGFGLAYAISEHISQHLRAFTLFATHFHELTALSRTIPTVRNYHVTAEMNDNRMTLLYKVNPGVCGESFGIRIAEMVKFPKNVIEDAWSKLRMYNPENESVKGEHRLKCILADENSTATEKAQVIRMILS